MGLMDWLKGRGQELPAPVAPAVEPPSQAGEAQLSRVLANIEQEQAKGNYIELEKLESYTEIAQLDRAFQAAVVRAIAQRLIASVRQVQEQVGSHGTTFTSTPAAQAIFRERLLLARLLTAIMRKKLPYSQAELEALLLAYTDDDGANPFVYPIGAIAAAAEEFASAGALDDRTRSLLARLLEKLRRPDAYQKEHRKPAERIAALLGCAPAIPLQPGEAWTDKALQEIDGMSPERQAAWTALLAHCTTATSANPTAKWIKVASSALSAVGTEEFTHTIIHWFPLVDLPRTADAGDAYQRSPAGSMIIADGHMDILRGLAWMSGLSADREVARALTALTISAFKKIPGTGPRALRVGNACITALGMMPGLDAVGQLALLKVKVKSGTAQIAIEKALTASAERAGVPREELEEMSVPAYGLTEVGRLVERFGDFTAELTITGSKTAEITWRRADGKAQKSLPAAVKTEFADEVKELNAAKKDIEKMLPAQAERIDSLYLQQKKWPLETWLARYLEHPLVGTLARRLIWNFTDNSTTTPGVWLNGEIVDRLGHPVALDAARTVVSLWHPLDQPPEIVLGWRGFLEEWEIKQPFKQAHREVYLLTPAEERTHTYSNRFASHLLKQHQFNALCAARGWKNKLRLMVDDEYPPAFRLLPQWGLRAEFWIEGAGDEFGTDTNETGTYLYVATDQVRFYPLDAAQLTAHAGGGGYGPGWSRPIAAEPTPLADVPPLDFPKSCAMWISSSALPALAMTRRGRMADDGKPSEPHGLISRSASFPGQHRRDVICWRSWSRS
jgi:hypothetical protein